jgi:hypothetical protein
MTRVTATSGLVLAVALGAAAPSAQQARGASPVTFTKDVAPILHARCASCHRPGEMAPMSLLTYQEARPWAKSIRQRVADRVMPPWFADPAHGEFENDARLPQKELDTILAWVDAGAVKGDDADMPAAPTFTKGWTIGEPDAVYTIPEFKLPASGAVPYTYFFVRTNYPEDRWISGVEIRPSNRKAVHHVIVTVLEPGVEPPPQGTTQARVDVIRGQLGGISPNKPGFTFPDGSGKLLKSGATIVFQMHYTPYGEEAVDRTTLGLQFAKATPEKHVRTGLALNPRFAIPPGAANHEVRATVTIAEDVHVQSLTPHMHFRGKSFTYTATYPDGRSEVLLNVPKYDFNWQLTYIPKAPIALPKGTKLECVAHFDNSTANKANPDPKAEVKWGDQTWEEMMIGFYNFTRDAEQMNTTTGASRH